MQRLFILLLLLSLGSCAKKTAPSAIKSGGLISLAAKEAIEYNNIRIKIVDIRDSRCPKDVQCIRAGEAIADFEIADQQQLINFSVCVGADCGRQKKSNETITSLGNKKYKVILENIYPYPGEKMNNQTQKVVFSIVTIK